jgi:hypothetical protein
MHLIFPPKSELYSCITATTSSFSQQQAFSSSTAELMQFPQEHLNPDKNHIACKTITNHTTTTNKIHATKTILLIVLGFMQ